MTTAAEYRTEHVAQVPRGYQVRTFAPGPRSDHLVVMAFPPGRRRRGAGQLVEILHPPGENPTRCANPSSVYSYAVSLGYPYLRGEGRMSKDGAVWLSRVTKTLAEDSPSIFVGWDHSKRKFIVEKEESNPKRKPPLVAESDTDIETWFERDRKHVELRNRKNDRTIIEWWDEDVDQAIEDGFLSPSNYHGSAYEYAVYIGAIRDPNANPSRRELQRGARDRAARIREARRNPGKKVKGLHVLYSPVNSAYFLMWHGTVLRIFPTKAEAKAEMEYLLRESKEAEKNPSRVRVFFDKGLGGSFVATVFHKKYGNLWASGKTKEEARAKLKEIVEKAESSGTWRNPDDGELADAEALFEEFHGREPREILEMQESAAARGDFAALGDLIELTMISPGGDHVLVKFKNDGVRVASSPDGAQLYLLGGNQDISGHLAMFGADESKDLIDLGEGKQIVYEAAKWQTDFTPQEWKHDFGEESGVRPRAFYDQLKKRIFFAGGNYKVERPGIVD